LKVVGLAAVNWREFREKVREAEFAGNKGQSGSKLGFEQFSYWGGRRGRIKGGTKEGEGAGVGIILWG